MILMLENIKSKKITDKKIRTNNNKIDEIVSLWKEVPNLGLNGDIYAVYYNYESDFNWDFDFLIGSENNVLNDTADIKEGKYMIWTADSPDAVGSIWQKIWNTELDRTYESDFEVYSRDGSVKIFIGIR